MLNLAFSLGRSSRATRCGSILGVALLALPLVITTAGCGGGAGGSTPFVNAPGPDASPQAFADYLDGDWTATLGESAAAIRVPMTLQAQNPQGPNFPVSGSLAGVELRDGGFSTTGGQPTLQFTTDALSVEGPTGPVEVPGPVSWTAIIEENRLLGTATGPDGQAGEWQAQKQ